YGYWISGQAVRVRSGVKVRVRASGGCRWRYSVSLAIPRLCSTWGTCATWCLRPNLLRRTISRWLVLGNRAPRGVDRVVPPQVVRCHPGSRVALRARLRAPHGGRWRRRERRLLPRVAGCSVARTELTAAACCTPRRRR